MTSEQGQLCTVRMMQTSHSRIGASGSACQGADLVSVFASTEAMLPKWLHTGVILPVVTSPFAYFDTELNVSSACFAGTAADINTVTLQDAESLLWNVRRSFASSILCLVGATAALKVGVVQAVATDNGHVSVQCLASTRLLFPPSLDGQPLPLPHIRYTYSGMRAAAARSRPAVSYNCSEMPKVHQKCVSIMLSSPKPLQQRLPAGLDKDFAFNSNAAGGQSTPLGKVCLSGNFDM